MLECEFCKTNPMTPSLTKCCKMLICPECKDKVQSKQTCLCGKPILAGKKIVNDCVELFEVVKKYKEGRRKECDRCDNNAELQCTNCDMLFCGNCNSEVHGALGFSKHQRKKYNFNLDVTRIRRKDAICISHNQIIILGCECGLGICTICLKNHKQNCPKGAKTKPLREFKQQYYLNILYKMRQAQQYKEFLNKDKQKYIEHYDTQKSNFSQQRRLLAEQFQSLFKLIDIKYTEVKKKMDLYWKQCQKIYQFNLQRIDQTYKKYDESVDLLGEFSDHMLNLDFFEKRISRTYLNFDYINFKVTGIQNLQNAALNISISQKNWQNSLNNFQITQNHDLKQAIKDEYRILSTVPNISEQIIEYTNNPLKDRTLHLLPNHNEILFNFVHIPHQHLKYELEYGVGMKMKGQQIFKKIYNSTGFGSIEGLNPCTKYRIRMRVPDGLWGPILEQVTLDIPRFNLENSLCAKAISQNGIQLMKGGAVYGTNQIHFGVHRWVIKMTSKNISYQESQTSCMSIGVSNKETKKAVFVGTTLNYGYQKLQIIIKVFLDCNQKRLVIHNSATNQEDVYQNLPNFPLFPTLQNKGNGQILIKYNLSTDDPNSC